MPRLSTLLNKAKAFLSLLGIGLWRVGLPLPFIMLLVDYYYRAAGNFDIDEVIKRTWLRVAFFTALGAFLERNEFWEWLGTLESRGVDRSSRPKE